MLLKKPIFWIWLLALLLAAQGTALATTAGLPVSININNSSFEADQPPSPDSPLWNTVWFNNPGIYVATCGPNSISGWNSSVPWSAGVFVPIVPGYDFDSLPSGLGPNSVWTMGSTISQDLVGSNLQAGVYTLNVLVGNRSTLGFDGNAYRVALYAGGNQLTATNDTHLIPTSGGWALDTLTYQITSNSLIGQQLQIQLLGGSSSTQVLFDNVSLKYTASSVPIPGSVLLLGSGLLGLMIWRRKRAVL